MHTLRRLFSSGILLCFLTFFFPTLAISQNGPGWIAGTVLDTGGAVLREPKKLICWSAVRVVATSELG